MTSRRRFLAALGSAAVGGGALAGCGYRPRGGDIRWEGGISRGMFGLDGLAVSGETLYTVVESERSFDTETESWTESGHVTAYALDDGGSRLWRESFDEPAVAHGTGGGDAAVGLPSEVRRYGPDGEQWRARVRRTSPVAVAADDRVYVAAEDADLIAYSDGEQRWRTALPSNPVSGGLVASSDGALVSCDGALVAVAPDGTELWTQSRTRQLSLAVEDRLAVGTERGVVMDAQTGERLWRASDHLEGVAVTDDRVYVVTDQALVARDRAGERQWSHRVGGFGAGVAADDRGVFVGGDRALTALDPDGSVRWAVDYDGIDDGPFLVDDGVVVVENETNLVCHFR